MLCHRCHTDHDTAQVCRAFAPAARKWPAGTTAAGSGPRWAAVVFSPEGDLLRAVEAELLTSSGAFLHATTFTPALRSRVRVRIALEGDALELPAEIIRHVSPVQAVAWRMSEGVAVRWVELTSDARRKLDRLLSPPPTLSAPTAELSPACFRSTTHPRPSAPSAPSPLRRAS